MSLSFDPDTLRQLAALLNETGMAEIELEDGERRLRLSRAVAAAPPAFAAPMMIPAAAEPAGAPSSAPADLARHPGVVNSPMVGVAYLAAEPGAANFIATGQPVEAGQTLLLIEAMKTFNQIKAPRGGTVTRILVGSGQPVEYGEPLVVIE